MTPDREDLTAWLIELLREDSLGLSVGDHGPPAFDGAAVYPFFVVWGIPGGYISGPAFGASTADAGFVFQVDSVGMTREQAGRAATRMRERVIGRTRTGSLSVPKDSPSGIVILDRYLDGAAGTPAAAGDRPNEVWTSSERYVLAVTTEV